MSAGITVPEQSGTPRFHKLSIQQVYETLATPLEGLPQTEVVQRLKKYGPNAIKEEKGKPLYTKLLSNFTHLMAVLLWVAGVVALIAAMPQLAIAIWLVNLINGAFSFWQEFRAEQATEALRKLIPHYVRVLRNGAEERIMAEDIVPGDVILLSEGDRVSADARLVQTAELSVDQSTLSGESYPVHKTAEAVERTDLGHVEMPNLVFAGTSIASGTGKAVVFATGMNTQFGKIAHLTQSVQEELSPLQKEMVYATKVVSTIAVGVGILFFILALTFTGVRLAEGFIFAMGMIVAFVPEGMLPLVTLSLAMGVQRMAKRHALVKRLSAVETLGCTTVICTDKTGTLTQNEMTVSDAWVGGHRISFTGVGYAPEGGLQEGDRPATPAGDVRELLTGALLCNNAHLLPPNEESPRWNILGDPTEAALLVAARKAGLCEEDEISRCPRLRELPFESRRKRMSTLHQTGAERVAYIKGAPKEVLALCPTIRLEGQTQPMNDALRAEIMDANDEYARRGLRVLAVATRSFPGDFATYTAEAIETDLVFLGLIAMMDPPRPEVAVAVEKCHTAGIRIVMITGDYGLTAESIARRIGIVQSERPRIVSGMDLDSMDDAVLKEALVGDVIFARVAPEHKLRVVATLQDMGHIVAVTGDGVNDSPALKKADIGVAMGIVGTDVAKEAADMILTDDNFASIVNAVEEGRGVYSNIKKFLSYIFTSNTPEAIPFILFVMSRARIPLGMTVMQILAVDLGTDMLPALALGAEPPEPGLMEQPPRNLKEHLINPALLTRAYFVLGPIQSLAAMAAFYFHYWVNGYWGQWLDLPDSGAIYRAATAMTLGAVVTTQIGNLFAQRTERLSFFRTPLFTNRLIWIGIASELVLFALLSYVPLLQQFFDTAAFPVWEWLFLFAWIPSLLIVDEVRKAFVRRRGRRRHFTPSAAKAD
ncbi:MAG: cation-transporting P-type ATPase [Anaerolineae bacterium]|nr:cation-transporting P-type ATPase [Anaerolineae bacterium]